MPCSLPEARSLIDAGKVKSLADHATTSRPRCTRTCRRSRRRPAATGRSAPGAASRRRRACRPTCATSSPRRSRRSTTSKEYKDFMAQPRLRRRSGPSRTSSRSSWRRRDADLGAAMKAVGIAEVAARGDRSTHQRRVCGVRCCCVLGGVVRARCIVQRLSEDSRARTSARRCSRALLAAGLVVCGAAADRARRCAARRAGARWLDGADRGCARRGTRVAFVARPRRPSLFYILAVERLGFLLIAPASSWSRCSSRFGVRWRRARCRSRSSRRSSSTTRSTSCCACRCPGACSSRSL